MMSLHQAKAQFARANRESTLNVRIPNSFGIRTLHFCSVFGRWEFGHMSDFRKSRTELGPVHKAVWINSVEFNCPNTSLNIELGSAEFGHWLYLFSSPGIRATRVKVTYSHFKACGKTKTQISGAKSNYTTIVLCSVWVWRKDNSGVNFMNKFWHL